MFTLPDKVLKLYQNYMWKFMFSIILAQLDGIQIWKLGEYKTISAPVTSFVVIVSYNFGSLWNSWDFLCIFNWHRRTVCCSLFPVWSIIPGQINQGFLQPCGHFNTETQIERKNTKQTSLCLSLEAGERGDEEVHLLTLWPPSDGGVM